MALTEKEVLHVAKLSAIALTPEETEEFRKELSDILEYVDQLGVIHTQGVQATSHVHGVVNAFRDDITKESLSLEKVQENAPDFAGSGFRVPKVI